MKQGKNRGRKKEKRKELLHNLYICLKLQSPPPRLHMSEKLSSGTINHILTNKSIPLFVSSTPFLNPWQKRGGGGIVVAVECVRV